MSLKFTTAITRTPCDRIPEGISSASLGAVDYDKAIAQHLAYVAALRTLGLDVIALPADNQYPDSTFVEDVALCTPQFAVVTNPGAASRNGEKQSMRRVLSELFEQVDCIESPGTVDAGDILMVGSHFYIGLSGRTNVAGADQMISILERHGRTASKVAISTMLHLKSGVSYLEDNHLLVVSEQVDHEAFRDFDRIEVEPTEQYAANSLWINGTVLVPEGFPETRARIASLGYPTIALEMSEFQKLDGGLSCLSLRF
jgi:dimethylargininase